MALLTKKGPVKLIEQVKIVHSSSLVSGIKVPNESACAAFRSHSVSWFFMKQAVKVEGAVAAQLVCIISSI